MVLIEFVPRELRIRRRLSQKRTVVFGAARFRHPRSHTRQPILDAISKNAVLSGISTDVELHTQHVAVVIKIGTEDPLALAHSAEVAHGHSLGSSVPAPAAGIKGREGNIFREHLVEQRHNVTAADGH